MDEPSRLSKAFALLGGCRKDQAVEGRHISASDPNYEGNRMVIQQKVVVQSHLLVHVQECVGMENRALAEGSVDVEQRGWRSVSRGDKRSLGAVICWGHCCLAQLPWAWRSLEDTEGREFPVSPPKAKGSFIQERINQCLVCDVQVHHGQHCSSPQGNTHGTKNLQPKHVAASPL